MPPRSSCSTKLRAELPGGARRTRFFSKGKTILIGMIVKLPDGPRSRHSKMPLANVIVWHYTTGVDAHRFFAIQRLEAS
jgi:hypothetical protein